MSLEQVQVFQVRCRGVLNPDTGDQPLSEAGAVDAIVTIYRRPKYGIQAEALCPVIDLKGDCIPATLKAKSPFVCAYLRRDTAGLSAEMVSSGGELKLPPFLTKTEALQLLGISNARTLNERIQRLRIQTVQGKDKRSIMLSAKDVLLIAREYGMEITQRTPLSLEEVLHNPEKYGNTKFSRGTVRQLFGIDKDRLGDFMDKLHVESESDPKNKNTKLYSWESIRVLAKEMGKI